MSFYSYSPFRNIRPVYNLYKDNPISSDSLLIDAFRANLRKEKDVRMYTEATYDWMIPTGFLPFDFRGGSLVKRTMADGTNQEYYEIGITDGSINTFFGRSGCGKTTFVIQSAANIVRRFPESMITFDSIEGGISRARLERLTKFTGDELDRKVFQRDSGVTAENFYGNIKKLYETKMANRERYTVDTGLKDFYGKPIYKMIPTVSIIDSVSLLMPEKYTEEEELSGQMAATQAAKTNAGIFRRLIQMTKTANIILFVINHVNDNVVINPRERRASKVSYLKQSEALPGGNTIVYLSNTLVRFSDHTKFDPDEDTIGIKGNYVDLEFVKSRNAPAGSTCTLVFDQVKGFDNDLSLYKLLEDQKRINGAGQSLYLKDRKDIKFSKRKFKEALYGDMDFRNLFMEEALEALKSTVSDPYTNVYEDADIDIANSILSNISTI